MSNEINENSMSESINELASALSKAQAVMESAIKDANNPFFKSKYADLAAVWSACKKPLTDNGLSIVQQIGSDADHVTMTTILLHASGQWIKSTAKAIPAKKDPQGIGSTATYLRRYGLSALVGVCTEDDDGNEGSSNYSHNRNNQTPNIVKKEVNHEKEKTLVQLQSIIDRTKEVGTTQGQQEQVKEISQEEQLEIKQWRDHISNIFLRAPTSPFRDNPKAAAQFTQNETGKALKDLNASEMEDLELRFLKRYPEAQFIAQEDLEKARPF